MRSSEVYRVGTVQLLRYSHGASGFGGFVSGRIREIGLRYPSPSAAEKEAPISLTASDGTGLRLVSLDANVRLDGPLATTELLLRFQNPNPRVVEGRFRIRLPTGASVSRLAMKIDGRWQEGEIAEVSKARGAYEDFLHRGQDPMLLEKAAGNEFKARIFPIPAKGYKDVRLSFSSELSNSGVYTLALKALPRIEQLTIRAKVVLSTGPDKKIAFRKSEMNGRNVEPEKDFRVVGEQGDLALGHKQAAVARVYPILSNASATPKSLVILMDTSASRAPAFYSQVQRLERLVSRLAREYGAGMPLKVAAFDQEIAPIFDGAAGEYGHTQSQVFLARRPLGASDIAAALHWAGEQGQASRVLLIGDVVGTAGAINLSENAKLLPDSLKRIDVLLAGGIRDEQAASRIVRNTRSEEGIVLKEEMSDSEIVSRLGSATSSLDVSVKGAEWVWPSHFDGLQQGDAVVVYAKFRESAQVPRSLAIRFEGAKANAPIPLEEIDSPILGRSLVQAQIARLQGRYEEATGLDERAKVRAEIVGLSVKHQVLSEHTAMLVMEDAASAADEDRLEVSSLSGSTPDSKVSPAPTPEPFTEVLPPSTVIDRKFTSNLPVPGRTFESALSAAAGSQSDGVGVSFAGSSSLENQYIVDGISRTGCQYDPGKSSSTRLTIPVYRALDFSGGRINNYAPNSNNWNCSGSEELLEGEPKKAATNPLSGKFAEIHDLLGQGKSEDALALAMRWRNSESGNVLALVALGESLEAVGVDSLAARAYGSIVDLYPTRADFRRFVAGRLARLGEAGLSLAVDSARKALEQRPDHLTSYRVLAISLLRSRDYSGAFDVLEKGILRDYPDGRFAGGKPILREDIAIVAKVWIAQDNNVEERVLTRLGLLQAPLASTPSLRFVLNWETDANDVDLHVVDGRGEHAFYGNTELSSGASISRDNTNGYGPESFSAAMTSGQFPYALKVDYFARGPMGYGMGQVEILQHDGKGEVRIESRPYVVMTDGASIDLGTLKRPLQ